MNERRWKQYFRQAGKYLYCDTSQKDIFEKQIRAAIADLQNENPMISYEECIAIIGLTTFVLSIVGVVVGNMFGSRYQKKAEIAGGMILILIGLKILLEHLGILVL